MNLTYEHLLLLRIDEIQATNFVAARCVGALHAMGTATQRRGYTFDDTEVHARRIRNV